MKKTIHRRLLVVTVLFIAFLIAVFSKLIYILVDDQETTSKKLLIEHYNLFTKEGQNKLQLLSTTTSRNRETTSNYIYDKRFNVFVLKVGLVNNYSLKNIISYKNEPSSIAMNAVYSDLSNFNMEMKIKSGKSVLASIIHFQFSGDSIKTIQKNDSLYCYYYKFKTFSINYNEEPYEIIAKANESSIPTSVVFKKKGKFLYIILMTIARGKEEMQSNQLFSIMAK